MRLRWYMAYSLGRSVEKDLITLFIYWSLLGILGLIAMFG